MKVKDIITKYESGENVAIYHNCYNLYIDSIKKEGKEVIIYTSNMSIKEKFKVSLDDDLRLWNPPKIRSGKERS